MALLKGDRVAYSAKFLRSIGSLTRDSADQRATVAGPSPFGDGKSHVRVRWDHHEADDYAAFAYDPELRDWYRANGMDVGCKAVAKLNTAAFADNATDPRDVWGGS